MNQPEKQSTVRTLKSFVKKNERKILITATVALTGTSLVLGRSVKLHNEFLKEHGLFDQFYDLAETTVEF